MGSEKEDYYFSVVDVINALTNSSNPRHYWVVLKSRLKEEGSELVSNCDQLKLKSRDGKYYKQDVLDTERIFRLIESVPSPNAEPFKLWLAKLGRQEVDNIFDPSKSIDNMTDIEIILTDLGEIATRELAKEHKPLGLENNKKIAKDMQLK